jgi:succinyl-diaminopimelate desuccinylase
MTDIRSKHDITDATILLTQELVRIASITPIREENLPLSHQVLDVAGAYAEKSGATVTRMEFDGDHPKWGYRVDNAYIEWNFGAASSGQEASKEKPDVHICYIGHLDVVPPGDAGKWRENPYSGDIRDGYLFGRGVTDMKGSVAAFMTAVENIAASLDDDKNIRISMILTTDEEWAAVNGTDKVLKWMRDHGQEPDAFIVGEPASQDELGSHIKIGRRGSLSGTFNVAGVQGHAAYQGLFDNPNRALSLAIAILNAHEWKDGNKNFPNTNFEAVALQSGDMGQTAIIPGTAKALWNIRFTPQHTPDSLEKWIQDKLANPPDWARSHPDAGALKKIEVVANKNSASIPYYSEPGFLAEAAAESIQAVRNISPKIDGSGGTTDGRFVGAVFPQAEIVEIGLPEHGGVHHDHEDHCIKGGMHQIDERAAVCDLIELNKIFKETVIRYAAKKSSAGKLRAPKSP